MKVGFTEKLEIATQIISFNTGFVVSSTPLSELRTQEFSPSLSLLAYKPSISNQKEHRNFLITF